MLLALLANISLRVNPIQCFLRYAKIPLVLVKSLLVAEF